MLEFKQDNQKATINIKTQEGNIKNLAGAVDSLTDVISGVQNRVIGIERNVGHMTAAVNNLTQTMMCMQKQMAGMIPGNHSSTMQSPSFLTIPNTPDQTMLIPSTPEYAPLVFKYDDGEHTSGIGQDVTMGGAEEEGKSQHIQTDPPPAPDPSGGGMQL